MENDNNTNENHSQEDDTLQSPLILSNEQILSLGVPHDLIGLFRQQYYRLGFGISKWYNNLSSHTIPTSFVELSETDAKSLQSFCELCKQLQDNASSSLEFGHVVNQLDSTSQQRLLELQNKIDQAISPWKQFGVFVKLDSRSPKDAVDGISSQYMRDLVMKEVTKELANRSSKTKSQATLDGFMKAQYKALVVHDAKETLMLLGKSSRILEDLTSTIPLMPFNISLCIVIRKWNEEMVETPEREFRGFVYKNQLNAVSQYDYMSCYPLLVDHEMEFQNRIQTFFNEVVRDQLKDYETYIIDFWVGQDSILIIELNSFESWTGACLFSWSENSKQLMHGPFEFRIVKEPASENLAYLIPIEWRDFIQQHLEAQKRSSSCIVV